MLGKTIYLVCMIFLVLPLLSGCWDSNDIENRATVLGIAIDKEDSDAVAEEENITHFPEGQQPGEELIRLTAQIAVPGRIPLGPQTGGGSDEQEPVWVLTTVGHTISDAMFNLQQELADEIFLGHLRIIVISEEIAKEGVKRFNDYLRRRAEVRRTAWVAVSTEKAAKYMKVAPKLERVPTLYLTAMIENAVELGKFPNDFIGLFWTILVSKGQDAFLPYLEIKSEDNIQIKALAYFKGEKMVGTIDPISIGIFMGVIGGKEGGYGAFVKVPGTEQMILLRALKRRSRIKTEVNDGKPEVRIQLRYETEINEDAQGKVNMDDLEVIRKIEKETSKDTTESLKNLIKKTQEDGSDIFGFGERFRAKHPAYWNEQVKTKDNWHNIYKELEVHVDTVTHIRREGMEAK